MLFILKSFFFCFWFLQGLNNQQKSAGQWVLNEGILRAQRLEFLKKKWRRRIAVDALRTVLQARRAAQRIVPVPAVTTDSAHRATTVVCDRCHAQQLLNRVGRTPAWSDVEAKRRVRRAFVDFVRDCGLAAPLLLVVDHWLPLSAEDPGRGGTFLSQELLALPNVRPYQIFTPNVDPEVVGRLEALGLLHARRLCCCLYLEAYEECIRRLGNGNGDGCHGGFAAAMVDVWGGYEQSLAIRTHSCPLVCPGRRKCLLTRTVPNGQWRCCCSADC